MVTHRIFFAHLMLALCIVLINVNRLHAAEHNDTSLKKFLKDCYHSKALATTACLGGLACMYKGEKNDNPILFGAGLLSFLYGTTRLYSKLFNTRSTTKSKKSVKIVGNTISSGDLIIIDGRVQNGPHIRGSGNIVTTDRSNILTSTVNRIIAKNSVDVIFQQGTHQFLHIESDDNIEPLVETVVSGDTLVIGMQPNTPFFTNKLLAYVTLQHIAGIESNGTGNIDVHGAVSSHEDLSLACSRNGRITTDSITAHKLTAQTSGTGNITVEDFINCAANVTLHSSNIGSIAAQDIITTNATLHTSGKGGVLCNKLTATRKATATIEHIGGITTTSLATAFLYAKSCGKGNFSLGAVHATEATEIRLSDRGGAALNHLSSPKQYFETSGNGSVCIDHSNGKTLGALINHVGGVFINSGHIDSQEIEINGTGPFNGERLVGQTGRVVCTSSGSAHVNIAHLHEQHASGTGSITNAYRS